MLEALWSIKFRSNLQVFGAGVVVLETGKIFGGDAQYFYIGNYKVKNDILSAEVECTHYGDGRPFSIAGIGNKFKFIFEGPIDLSNRSVINCSGCLADNKSLKVTVQLTRRAELP